jgi:hypothetical protein
MPTWSGFATIKYDSDGIMLWEWIYKKSQNVFEEPVSLAVDADGNAFVAGRDWEEGTFNDHTTVKCDSAGNFLWERKHNGPGNLSDRAHDIQLDAAGSAYVTGYSTGVESLADIVTVKYSSDGDTIWVHRYDGPVSEGDIGTALQVDEAGNVYVTGWISNGSSGRDYVTIKYSPCTCNCPRQGDGDADGFITALDLALIIDVLFGGAADIQDVCCPTSRFDLDCDGFATALDLSDLIDHLFAGGDGPCDVCAP